MSIVSQKVDARNEIGWTGFVRAANKWLVNSATGWILAPIWAIPEAFTTDVNDVQGQFPVVYNTDRMPYAAVSNTQYYYDNTVVGWTITTTATPISLGKGVVSEEGGYILLDIPQEKYYSMQQIWNVLNFTATNNTWVNMNISYTVNIPHAWNHYIKVKYDAMTTWWKAVWFARILVDWVPSFQFASWHNFLNLWTMTWWAYDPVNDAPFEWFEDVILYLPAWIHNISYEFINFVWTTTVTNAESEFIIYKI